jgi:hypothetical protein
MTATVVVRSMEAPEDGGQRSVGSFAS